MTQFRRRQQDGDGDDDQQDREVDRTGERKSFGMRALNIVRLMIGVAIGLLQIVRLFGGNDCP